MHECVAVCKCALSRRRATFAAACPACNTLLADATVPEFGIERQLTCHACAHVSSVPADLASALCTPLKLLNPCVSARGDGLDVDIPVEIVAADTGAAAGAAADSVALGGLDAALGGMFEHVECAEHSVSAQVEVQQSPAE